VQSLIVMMLMTTMMMMKSELNEMLSVEVQLEIGNVSAELSNI
jgi:hypothetical protein